MRSGRAIRFVKISRVRSLVWSASPIIVQGALSEWSDVLRFASHSDSRWKSAGADSIDVLGPGGLPPCGSLSIMRLQHDDQHTATRLMIGRASPRGSFLTPAAAEGCKSGGAGGAGGRMTREQRTTPTQQPQQRHGQKKEEVSKETFTYRRSGRASGRRSIA